MTRDDLRILCTALGFLVTNLKGMSLQEQAPQAKKFARIIESGCLVTEPAAFGATIEDLSDEGDPDSVDRVIEKYKAELESDHEAQLPDDRQRLLTICRRLMVRKLYREQNSFFTFSDDDKIADRILELAEEEIAADGAIQ